ncbi:MAG: hypothetical protein ACRDK4_04310 [Solirubrobacteraceae bacterium]
MTVPSSIGWLTLHASLPDGERPEVAVRTPITSKGRFEVEQ